MKRNLKTNLAALAFLSLPFIYSFASSDKTEAPSPKPSYNEVKGRCYSGGGKVRGYFGRCSITQFTNDDFPVRETTCGQAAAVTALWNAGLFQDYSNGSDLANSFYKAAPPKITIGGILEAKGSLGTDWRQINSGLDKYKHKGISYAWEKGEARLKDYLRENKSCLIMLDTGTLPQYGYKWFTGHWVVAYGYDGTYVYVTNFPNNKILWSELKKAWGGTFNEGHLAKAHGTAEMFCAVWK